MLSVIKAQPIHAESASAKRGSPRDQYDPRNHQADTQQIGGAHLFAQHHGCNHGGDGQRTADDDRDHGAGIGRRAQHAAEQVEIDNLGNADANAGGNGPEVGTVAQLQRMTPSAN